MNQQAKIDKKSKVNLKRNLFILFGFIAIIFTFLGWYKVNKTPHIDSNTTKPKKAPISDNSTDRVLNAIDASIAIENPDFLHQANLQAGECHKPEYTVSPCQLRCKPTEEEMKYARVAWKYVENNFNEKTGLTAAAHHYPSGALWDWANGVFAIYAALKFDIIDQDRFEDMMSKFITGMDKMELFNNELPNKTYNTNIARMVDYANRVKKDGIGWSAADMARLLSSLNMIEQCEENIAPQIEKLLLRYRYCRILSIDGNMYGGNYINDRIQVTQEALTGYEEYLARGYQRWGHNADEAASYKHSKLVNIYGYDVPTDTRPFFINLVESEPFLYLGFEYGLKDPQTGRFVYNVFKVQEERYKRTGQMTAMTEDNIDVSPYFLFNNIYTDGELWKTVNQHGEDYDEYKTVSTKAAIGMSYIMNTNYTHKLFNYIKNNYHPDKGYYAGIYEKRPGQNKALTLNTNAIVLEAMLSSKMGPLQKLHKIESRGVYDDYRNRVNNFRCLPTDNTKKTLFVLEPYDPEMVESNGSKSCGGCSEKNQGLDEAKIAWNYFENNYNPETGLVNGVNKYKIVTPDHIGRTLMATISAESLDIIYKDVFNKRISKLLETLKTLKLYNNELPNTYYDAKTGKAVTKYGKEPKRAGGWDLYGIAHLMTGLHYLEKNYPEYREDVFRVIARWKFKRAVKKSSMENRWFDGKSKGGAVEIEDYAKEFYIFNALRFFNIESYSHLYDERNLDYKAAYDYEVPMAFKHRISNGESYLWTMMEQPYYLKYKHYSSNIYMALKSRYESSNKFATSTEEPLDRKPYWIQNTIYNEGKLWENLNKKGKAEHKKGLLSTKAAFIYDALYGYKDDYAKVLMDEVKGLAKEGFGWYGGIYLKSKYPNKSLNIMTNSAVLEAIHYKKFGNFYYEKEKKLYNKIKLHRINLKDKYFLESNRMPMRHTAEKLIEKFEDEDIVARVLLKDMDFIVRLGAFDTVKEALDYMDKLKVNIPRAHVVKGDINSDNFMLSTHYVNYDYHRPYENKLIAEESNEAYISFLKKYKKEKKVKKAKKN